MIYLRNLSLHFGEQAIFDDVSCAFEEDQKIGFVGRNGAGKSTLLKIIAGLQGSDSGTVTVERRRKVAYLPQEVLLQSEKTVEEEAFSVFEELCALEKEIHDLEKVLHVESPDTVDRLERYAHLQMRLADFDLGQARLETSRILQGLGFNNEQLKQTVNELSVGWKMRLVLTKLLLAKADFYLFDEPTNHLDIVTKGWLFNFLKNSKSGFLLVSHDRYFLDHLCETTIEIERGKLTWYKGNFTTYTVLKEEARKTKLAAYERQQREIAHKKEIIAKFKASASRASQAQSMMKALDRIDIIEPDPVLPTIKFSFPEVARTGHIVLKVAHLGYSFETKKIFEEVSFEVERGEKIALVAPNGVGKTTLFNVIAGKYPLQSGTITVGHHVKTALFEQDQLKVLIPSNTVLQEVERVAKKLPEKTMRGFLGSFLFGNEEVKKRIDVLSGGERNRVAMVKVLLEQANFMLLDEPTNHLDLYAKEILLQALQQFNGTMLFVSHDQDFLSKLATRIIELTPTGIISYKGDYESYLWAKQQAAGGTETENKPSVLTQTQKTTTTAKSETKLSNKEQFIFRKELKSLENKITKLETELQKQEAHLTTPSYNGDEHKKTTLAIQELKETLKRSSERWNELQALLE